jgi:anti-sigma factor RsiW
MSTHPDPEQLSAYIDGELADADRDELEQHLTGCSECSATLRGLRATVADMRALPSPTPSEQDLWALRSAIAKARRTPAERYRRWVIGAGGAAAVAAAIVGVLVLNHNTMNKPGTDLAKGAAAVPSASSQPRIEIDPVNYDAISAGQLLVSVREAFDAPQAYAPAAPAVSGSAQAGGATTATSNGPTRAVSSADQSAYAQKIAACERDVFSRGSGGARAIAYVVGRYESTPAFFLIYSVVVRGQTKTEMWVVQQSNCYIRLFLAPR